MERSVLDGYALGNTSSLPAAAILRTSPAMRARLCVLAMVFGTVSASAQDAGLPQVVSEMDAPAGVLRHQRVVGDVTLQALMAVTPKEADAARAAADEAFQEFARVQAAIQGPDGAVERINRNAGVSPVPVGPEAFQVLQEALRVCSLTDGAYDPTAAIYEPLWPFQASGFNQSPPPEELTRRVPLVDCRQLVLDVAARTAFLRKPGMRIGLWDLPRAVALDRAMETLHNRGFGDAIIQAQGDVVVSGHKAGKRWMVGLQDPRGTNHFAAVPVEGGAVSTVGDYEQAFFERGRRLHSVLDPKSGQPSGGVRSVTILARSGAEAAALARGVFVLGPERGMKLVDRLPDVEAVMVDGRNRVLVSKKLAGELRYRPPTDGP